MAGHIEALDLFCGAGGTSTGILQAVRQDLRRRIHLTAVNHWPTAIDTHSLNHPDVRHICEPVENLWPARVIPSRRLHLLAASCECTFHSNARGGGPCNEQSRAQPWQIIRWASDIRVDNILMENVREWENWGPLLTRGIYYKGRYYPKQRPDPRRKGEYFKAFLQALTNLGYRVEYRYQCAADFGDPTSRVRLMLIARLGKPVKWPKPMYGPGRRHPYRTARECIDWSIPGTSLFKDGKPRLCKNTVERIAAGLKKFGGPAAEPFLVLLRGTSGAHKRSCAQSVDEPVPAVTANGNHVMLCQPFVLGQQSGAKPRTLDEPAPTVATKGAIRLVEPIIVQTDQTGGKGAYARPVDAPVGTIVSKQNMMLVQPMILKYYRTGVCKSVDEPLDAITTKDRFLLVEPRTGRTVAEMDILTRMIQPHELALCHSFENYRFTGTREEQTKQIGNSVPVRLARAHARAALS